MDDKYFDYSLEPGRIKTIIPVKTNIDALVTTNFFSGLQVGSTFDTIPRREVPEHPNQNQPAISKFREIVKKVDNIAKERRIDKESTIVDIENLLKYGTELEVIANAKAMTVEELLVFMNLNNITNPRTEKEEDTKEIQSHRKKMNVKTIIKPIKKIIKTKKRIRKVKKSNFYNPKEIVEVDHLTWDQLDQKWGNFMQKNNLIGTSSYYHEEKKQIDIFSNKKKKKINLLPHHHHSSNRSNIIRESSGGYVSNSNNSNIEEVENLMKDLDNVSRFSTFITKVVSEKVSTVIGFLMEKNKREGLDAQTGIPFNRICLYLDKDLHDFRRPDVREAMEYLVMVKIIREVDDDLFVLYDFV